MPEKVKVEQVSVELVRRLRAKILRPGLSLEASIYPSDSLFDAQHFAAWLDNKIVAVASIHPEILPESLPKSLSSDLTQIFKDLKNIWRLRGMAVDSDFQRKGIGKLILLECTGFIKQFEAKLLWCNARVQAIKFYQSLGFEIIGEKFDVPESGAHFVMILRLKI